MYFADVQVHRSFAAKNAAQDDKGKDDERKNRQTEKDDKRKEL
jgi:hypothetical protein